MLSALAPHRTAKPSVGVCHDPPDVAAAVGLLQSRSDAHAPLNADESAAVGTIYAGYRDMLIRTAERYVGVAADAEDVVQEVALRLPLTICQYQHGGLGAWLRRIVVTTVLMRLRRERWEAPLEETDRASSEVPDELVERVDLVRRALAILPKKQREVVVLRFFLDYTHEEIAKALGITATASEIRLCRALKALRVKFALAGVKACVGR